jgi:hypothetical protein
MDVDSGNMEVAAHDGFAASDKEGASAGVWQGGGAANNAAPRCGGNASGGSAAAVARRSARPAEPSVSSHTSETLGAVEEQLSPPPEARVSAFTATSRAAAPSSPGAPAPAPPGAVLPARRKGSNSADSSSGGDGGGRGLFSLSLIRQNRDAIQSASLEELWELAQGFLLAGPLDTGFSAGGASDARDVRRAVAAPSGGGTALAAAAAPRPRISERRKLELLEAEVAGKLQQVKLLEQQQNWLLMREAVLNDLMRVNQEAGPGGGRGGGAGTSRPERAPAAPMEADGGERVGSNSGAASLALPPPPLDGDGANAGAGGLDAPTDGGGGGPAPPALSKLVHAAAAGAGVAAVFAACASGADARAHARAGEVEGALAAAAATAAPLRGREAGDTVAREVAAVLAEIQSDP